MNVYGNIKELIGNTPIVELTKFSLPQGVRLFAKLEYFNPGGSVKDRLGVELIRAAEESGQLQPAARLSNRLREIRGLAWLWRPSGLNTA